MLRHIARTIRRRRHPLRPSLAGREGPGDPARRAERAWNAISCCAPSRRRAETNCSRRVPGAALGRIPRQVLRRGAGQPHTASCKRRCLACGRVRQKRSASSRSSRSVSQRSLRLAARAARDASRRWSRRCRPGASPSCRRRPWPPPRGAAHPLPRPPSPSRRRRRSRRPSSRSSRSSRSRSRCTCRGARCRRDAGRPAERGRRS
jgi:hypothetical protein